MRALVLGLLATLLLAGCGSSAGGEVPGGEATLLLDFQPNAVHSGIYLATDRGFDEALGVELDVQVPSSSSDSVRLLLSGQADLAVLSIHDLAIAREQGRDLVGVMALVQRPLASVLALPPIEDPRDLEGERVGVTGLPSDDAVARSVVQGAGGDPDRLRLTTIGFNAVPSLLAGNVAAATAFWSVEGLALRAKRPQAREFRVDELGAPRYPELVVTVTRSTLDERPALVQATTSALARGYGEVLRDPENAVSTLVDSTEGLDREVAAAQLDALLPAFSLGTPRFGELDRERLGAWARWEAEFGIVKEPPNVALAFDERFAPEP
ncbi:MAG TPA: ABC transporter substrate-binding protein [Solirubrobacteraceae bacterium]|nr:ABC transporter substrate-binding protein [Solirubrobacteraceae bacterium]